MTGTCPVAGVSTVDFDHHDAALDDDRIWAAYAAVREHGNVAWSPAHGGFWVVSGFDAVRQALRDPGSFSSGEGHRIPGNAAVRSIPIDFDPPLHTAYRAIVMEALRPEKVRALRPWLNKTIDNLWSAFRDNGGGDAVSQVALPLPLAVLEKLIGFSPESVAQFREHTERLAASVTSPEQHAADRVAIAEVLRGELDRHRATRPDDYITWLLRAEIDGRLLEERELVSVLNTLAVAGHETTMNSVGSLLYLLATDAGLQRSVREERVPPAQVVEETFRFRTPAQMFSRYTTREVTLDGTTIPAGQWVLLLYAAANRDPARFADADVVRPGRPERGHLAFGWGIHQCVGAALARYELHTLLTTMNRSDPIALDGRPVFTGVEAGVHYGFRSLRLRFLPDDRGEVRA
ncbi:cytochrome P450 [Qaidamihabitans albus]|uniref:cytochrome P450 n=1 Tax=Qaidamihabitans albus TaxID=2795733 RepID=UPI0018F2480B|nr:cytochrome P450 [Qaidamihabitans albus]